MPLTTHLCKNMNMTVLSYLSVDEIYELISKNRIKDIRDPRYSNQNFLNLYGVK